MIPSEGAYQEATLAGSSLLPGQGLMGESETMCSIWVYVGTESTVVCKFISFGDYCPWGFIN